MSLMYCHTCGSYIDTEQELMYNDDMCESCAVDAQLYPEDIYPELKEEGDE
jgi:NMD protein affecting ribosome stability and mRNA decay